jgi:hypothetical protein
MAGKQKDFGIYSEVFLFGVVRLTQKQSVSACGAFSGFAEWSQCGQWTCITQK